MRTRSQTKRSSYAAGLVLAALVGGAALGGVPGVTPAHALDLPTWSDVEAAKQNEATAAAKVTEIEGLLAQSAAELERLRNESAKASAKAQIAEEQLQEAARREETLGTQAAQSQVEADTATEQAAALVSQMYRSGGVDRNIELFLESEGDTADALLERLATMSKATERNTNISQEAQRAMNTAATLTAQAEQARAERERLQAEAEALAQEAAAAAASQLDRLVAQEEQQKVLETQLAALKDTTTQTVAGYQERLRVEEEERQRLAREAAERAAAEAAARAAEAAAAAAANPGGGGGNPGGGNPGGGNSSGGWLVPARYGFISTTFQQWWGHTGIDLASACWTPIIAPRSGTISYIGYKDNIGGNMIHIDHGGGVQTRYAHLAGFASNWGQWVNQGQVVGYVGTTGMSTGCHLHYEVLVNGIFQNPLAGYFG